MVTSHKHLYRLSRCCVFVKQLFRPRHCEVRWQFSRHHRAQGLYRRYASDLPNSLTVFNSLRLSFLCQGHLFRFFVRSTRIVRRSLFTGSWSRHLRQKDVSHSTFRPVLEITSFPGLHVLAQIVFCGCLSDPVGNGACVTAGLPGRYRDINRFPLRVTLLCLRLGPTDPPPISVEEEP